MSAFFVRRRAKPKRLAYINAKLADIARTVGCVISDDSSIKAVFSTLGMTQPI